jgi:hypothetical protein
MSVDQFMSAPRFELLPDGGRITHTAVVVAIAEFLSFQRQDHRSDTGGDTP